ncbi:hypothetical protein BVX94_00950 [bacterium B17]|nr:hypothetical protein BVX94_00950 [bacterium B17]
MKIRMLAFLILISIATRSYAEPVLLKVNWVPGEQQVVDIKISQDQSVIIPGMQQPMKQLTEQILRTQNTVLPKTTSDGVIVELKFLSTKLDTDMNGIKMSFDSDSDPSTDTGNPMAPIMRGMIGSSFKYHMSADGSLEKVAGIDKFVENISQGNPNMKAMMSQMFNEDAVKEMSGAGLDANMFPKKAVDVGAKWTDEKTAAAGPLGATSVQTTYNFKGWEKKDGIRCALITFTGDMNTVEGGKAPEAMMGVTIDSMEGTTSGKILFDNVDGVIRSSETLQKMKIIMSTPAQPGAVAAEGQEMEVNITQKITNTLVSHKKK